MNRVSLVEQPQDVATQLAEIRARKQELAPLALRHDKVALKELDQLDATATALRRESELVELAALEAAKQQAEQEAEAIRKARAARELQAKQEAEIILSTSKDIDAALLKLREIFERRHRALRALANTRVCATHLVNRMFGKHNATAALRHFDLHNYISCEAVLPAHIKCLTEWDSWLSKPLTAVDEPMPDDDEPAPRTNGATNA